MSLHAEGWAQLRHGGLLISPAKLDEFFPDPAAAMSDYQADKLRRALTAFDGSSETLGNLLDYILQDLSGLPAEEWQKAQAVDSRWVVRSFTGVQIKPRRLWLGPNGETLAVFTPDDSGSRQFASRLGVGRSKQLLGRVVEWLRRTGQALALVTNGRQWRLVYAGADYEAWCEWDIELWFSEGQPAAQTLIWRTLLNRSTLLAEQGQNRLLQAISASRKGQAELSNVLGERVRQGVEELITASHVAIEQAQQQGQAHDYKDLYVAGSRIIMRCIITLFAEARGLMPVDNPIYQQAYSLEGLRHQLDRRAGGRGNERLSQGRSAWPRLIGLFNLIHEGSAHERLSVPQYGGALFEPGNPASDDGISRALALLESSQNLVSDLQVHKLLRLLTRTKMKVRQGRSSRWVDAPVDFSILSSEYIGILYEGLLDFELKQAADNDPVIFLAVGNQPALTLSQLEAMDDKAIKQLFEALKKKDSTGDDSEEEADEVVEESADLDDNDDEADAVEDDSEEDTNTSNDSEELTLSEDHLLRANTWLQHAAQIAGLVKKPRGRKANTAADEAQQALEKAAKQLCARIVAPGQFFLVRWGGTRKGAGTFYTRPQLAAPTVRRTLQPLAYDAVQTETDPRTGLDSVVEWAPKTPEQILALKVCDPAMGSGSFLAGALRYLTEALTQSLFHHKLIERSEDGGVPRMADGKLAELLSDELTKLDPKDDGFEEALRAQLKRHIVERCLYGVDLDPLAVELGRMALWVETMDRDLPFGFLDHKLKVGNALVGTWFDSYRDYPAMAWQREGGDKDYQKNKPDNLINHWYEDAKGKRKGDVFTDAIKARAKAVPEQLQALLSGQLTLEGGLDAANVHDELLKVFRKLHRLPVHESEKRAEIYQQEVLNNPHYHALKARMDLWCALWFWPGEQIELAPLPRDFANPGEQALAIAAEVARRQRFFHWELEFPDVFTASQDGFDALLGNPPWEIQKPNSKEFFSNHDPLYRAYGKQDALAKQLDYFSAWPQLEHDWIAYNANLKGMSNWAKYVGKPFGDRVTEDKDGKKKHDLNLGGRGRNSFEASAAAHKKWLQQRNKHKGYANAEHPFLHQGSADLNTYKLFFEQFLHLASKHARVGIIVPSSVHNDQGSFALRQIWIKWLDLIVKFDNEKRIFEGLEHNSKFDVIVLDKACRQKNPVGAFFSWVDADVLETIDSYALPIDIDFIKRVSPSSLSVPEVRSLKDKEILEKIYSCDGYFGDSFWPVTEFHMTSDSSRFCPDGEIPLYQGGMIWINDHRYNFFDETINKFRRGKLESVEMRLSYPLKPKYFVNVDSYVAKFKKNISAYSSIFNEYRLVFRVQTSRSNQRSFISTVLPPGVATGNSLASMHFSSRQELIFRQALLSSLVNDFNVRTKINSNVNSFYIPQLANIAIDDVDLYNAVIENSLRLICTSSLYKELFGDVANSLALEDKEWGESSFYATELSRRRAQAINDAIFMHCAKLSCAEVDHILSSFPGIDRSLDFDVRYDSFVMDSFRSLSHLGAKDFLAQNHGFGWIPRGLDYCAGKLVASSEYGEKLISLFGGLTFDWQIDPSLDNDWKKAEAMQPALLKVPSGLERSCTSGESAPHKTESPQGALF